MGAAGYLCPAASHLSEATAAFSPYPGTSISFEAEELKIEVMLTRYWFEFDIESAFKFPPGIGLGCGITAYDLKDAMEMMNAKIFFTIKMPPLKRIEENIDIRVLDQGHVIPNMKIPVNRGIWFPLGYD